MEPRAPARPARLVLVLSAAGVLVLGLNAGLLLLGLPMPIGAERLAELHAPLLVFGAIGALISLERAVALRTSWAYAAPALMTGGALIALTPAPPTTGPLMVVAGLAVHVWQYRAIWRRQPMTATTVQALGAITALVAAVAWSGGVPPSRLVPLLAVYLILTIVGERLELARLNAPGLAAERLLFVLALTLSAAAVVSLTVPTVAVPVAGVLLIALSAWLLQCDVARTTVRMSGLPRFVAACLLVGYVWLIVAGAGWVLGGARTEGAIYDATTHAIFLGFVVTMIMAHAPIILPAVLGVRIPYHAVLYVPVGLLHAALLARVVAGDAWGWIHALQTAGVTAAVAMMLYGVLTITVSARARFTERQGGRRVEA